MPKLLIVDDHSAIVDVLRRYATHDGYEVVTAADGEEALQRFKNGESRLDPA